MIITNNYAAFSHPTLFIPHHPSTTTSTFSSNERFVISRALILAISRTTRLLERSNPQRRKREDRRLVYRNVVPKTVSNIVQKSHVFIVFWLKVNHPIRQPIGT
ncbi:unnamed protein product [Schistosoma rodhaini]|nr:unnamed protein product [Schistosoma rodhaini]